MTLRVVFLPRVTADVRPRAHELYTGQLHSSIVFKFAGEILYRNSYPTPRFIRREPRRSFSIRQSAISLDNAALTGVRRRVPSHLPVELRPDQGAWASRGVFRVSVHPPLLIPSPYPARCAYGDFPVGHAGATFNSLIIREEPVMNCKGRCYIAVAICALMLSGGHPATRAQGRHEKRQQRIAESAAPRNVAGGVSF